MTRLGSSSSVAESTMEDDQHRRRRRRQTIGEKPNSLNTTATTTTATGGFCIGEGEQGEEESFEEVDVGVWGNFTDNFRQVQSVLDRNRVLIQQVNENHQSKIHDNMVKNVALIQEINGNISKVVSLYSELSSNFSSLVHAKNDKGDNASQPSIDQIQRLTVDSLFPTQLIDLMREGLLNHYHVRPPSVRIMTIRRNCKELQV